jgi:DNA polymerase-3 subunit alpha
VQARGEPLTLHGLCREADPQQMPRTCWEALIKGGCFDPTESDRGELLIALDGAMNEAVRAAEDRRSGQGSLFAGLEASASPPLPRRQPAAQAGKGLARAEALRAEKEVLGFYLSGHPLEERAGLFAMLSTVRTVEVAARPPGSLVTIAGLIASLTESLVKSGTYAGRKMARFRLEDLDGGVQVVVFPRTYEELRHKLSEDAVVAVVGKVEEREEPGLILEQVLSIEEALQRFEGGLVVHIEPEDQELLPRLKRTLEQHRGQRPVYFMVRGGDGHVRRVKAGGELRVEINAELTAELGQLLGRGRVKLARL